MSTTTIAGISVPDTPLVNAAISHARQESPPWLFNHVIRSWLFAVKLAESENPSLDAETLAVAAILHDMGIVPHHGSADRRFEVDGALSAVSFLKSQYKENDIDCTSPEFFKRKLRELTVWDAIAMHTTPSLAHHSIPEVSFCHRGTAIDITGQVDTLPDAAATMQAVFAAYPRLTLKDDFRESMCAIVRHKPHTTYDNFVGAIGEAYVDGYTRSKKNDETTVAIFRPDSL